MEGNDKSARLKAIVDRLAAGAKPSDVKKEFHELIRGADAGEVASMEQSLIEGGMPVEEVQRLCEVHADVFREGLERAGTQETLPGHPVHTYLAENREARKRLGALRFAGLFGNAASCLAAAAALKPMLVHYTRKENQLFPFLETKGFTGPSKVMWGKHDEVRALYRELEAAANRGDAKAARRAARSMAARMGAMIFMEEKILYPNAMKRLSALDWATVRLGEEAIGFAWVKPGAVWDAGLAAKDAAPSAPLDYARGTQPAAAGTELAPAAATIRLSEGSLPVDVLDSILRSLPVDVSFVDADDKVAYYSDSPDRVFPRSPGVIGRAVRNCHPPKSVAVVERILDSFRKKEKDRADFWIDLHGRFVLISYRAVYAADGSYRGTLEYSMDATAIRALTGERRLLDW